MSDCKLLGIKTLSSNAEVPHVSHIVIGGFVLLKVWQRLQRIECLAEQISAAQAGKSPGAAAESSPPLNALNHSANRAARRGV